jgi:hypothetical protein
MTPSAQGADILAKRENKQLYTNDKEHADGERVVLCRMKKTSMRSLSDHRERQGGDISD